MAQGICRWSGLCAGSWCRASHRGRFFDPTSDVALKVASWLETDGIVLLAGVVAALLIVRWSRLRPLSLLLAVLWAVVVRGGYLPGPYPVGLIWPSALAVALCSARLLALLRKLRVGRARAGGPDRCACRRGGGDGGSGRD